MYSEPILLRATLPRAQALSMIALTLAITLFLTDFLFLHRLIPAAPLPSWMRVALLLFFALMIAAVAFSIRSLLRPPVLVEATQSGVRNSGNRQAAVIPWRSIASIRLEHVITGDSRAWAIALYLTDRNTQIANESSYLPQPPAGVAYLSAETDPGKEELLRELERLWAAYR